MKHHNVDVAIIGAGTAGLAAYRAARAQGKQVLLIESGPHGTTCARVGCMPSKLLIAAAEAARTVAGAPAFGVQPGKVVIDGCAVMARVRSERDRFVGFVLDAVAAIPEADRLCGHARFTGSHTLQVDQHSTVEARSIVIATGSTPIRPAQLADAGSALVTSDAVFDWQDLPRSVAVIGSGAIGLELGQALARLGVRVAVFARDSGVAQLGDPQVLAVARAALARELDLRFDTSVLGAQQDGAELVLDTRDSAGALRSERYQFVLAAVGRSPNVQALGLEHTGLALDKDGVPLFDRHTMQCGQSHIFIAGDADHERALLPEAADEGRIAGDNAGRYPAVHPGLRRCALSIAFTEPQIASVGAGYRALHGAGRPACAIGMVSFENQGRSRVMLQNHGMLRVYGEYGSERFLGAELAGPRAEHLAHLLAWACQARMTVTQMLEMPFYHPVVEEGVRTALRDLATQLALGAPRASPCPDCTPGV